MGRPFKPSRPKTAVREAIRTVNSKVMGMKAGQLLKGLPSTFNGKLKTFAYHCKKKPLAAPNIPAMRTTSGRRVLSKPTASAKPSMGMGENASMLR